mgnify:CR=1 FL=1
MCIRDRVANNAAEQYVELFGRSAGNRGRTVRALVGLEPIAVSYTHLRAHETVLDLVCRLLLEKKKNKHEEKH